MNLVEEYQVIQWVIAKEMLKLLQYDGEESLQEWVDRKEELLEKLNTLVVGTLSYSKQRILNAVSDAFDEAASLIDSHILQEWGFEMAEHDRTAQMSATIQFLNENVMRGLYSSGKNIGSVERTFESILKRVKETEIQDDQELAEVLNVIIYEELKDGFYSGFIQSDGLRWRMDRYVNQIAKHIYQDTYTRVLRETLFGKGVELVKVHKFVKPRDTCSELQTSGIICIVPRNEASEEALQHPNIWDERYKYTLPGGHHGK